MRKWLVGRGIKRTGLLAPRTVTGKQMTAEVSSAATLQFSPVEVAPVAVADATPAEAAASSAPEIHIELSRGATQLCVRWPSAQAAARIAWLRGLAAVALKD